MRAWLLDRPGSPGSLRSAEVLGPFRSRPRRAEVELLVAVDAVGVTLSDARATGAGASKPAKIETSNHADSARILGADVAGRVVGVRAEERIREEQNWRIPALGTRVLFHQDPRQPGGFAEQVAVDGDIAARVPAHLDPIAAASLPTGGLIALAAVERRLRRIEGQTVLVTGAPGGVAGFVIQLAKLFGAKVIATAAGPNEEALARGLGALFVVPADPAGGWRSDVRKLAPQGVDAIVDTVSASSATAALDALGFAGHLVATAGRPDLSAVQEEAACPSVSEVALDAIFTHAGRAGQRQLIWGLDRLMTLVYEGYLQPPPIQVVGFDDIPEALAGAAAGRPGHGGTVVANLRWR